MFIHLFKLYPLALTMNVDLDIAEAWFLAIKVAQWPGLLLTQLNASSKENCLFYPDNDITSYSDVNYSATVTV